MGDIHQKYQKLAAEYSKLRAQVPVLKKAVLDEKATEAKLQESLKEKDQVTRKYEQEIDSLTFRNQQLSTRVSLLQDELDQVNTKNKKQKKGAPPVQNSTETGAGVLGEELQSKIEENARLHKQVYEADMEHRQLVTQLQDRLSVLEKAAGQHEEVLQAAISSGRDHVQKLQEEKALLEARLQQQEKGMKDAVVRASSLEDQLKQVETDLSTELQEATQTIESKITFNDTKHFELNSLNIPTHDRRHQLRAKELSSQAMVLIKELTQSLSNWHTYSEQRCRVYPNDADREPLTEVNKKLSSYLHENVVYLRPIEQAFHVFQESIREDSLTTLETATELQDFAAKFKKYVLYASKLLPYHLLSLEEECSLSSCTGLLEAKNMELHSSYKLFTSAFANVETYLSLLAAQSGATCSSPKSSYPKLFHLLAKAVTHLHDATKEISKLFNAKVSLEHQLPTATQKLKTTDECVVSSLVSLVTCTSKLSAFVAGNLDFFCSSPGHSSGGSRSASNVQGQRSHPAVTEFRQRAAHYLSSLSKGVPESVPYAVALKNRKTLYSSTESRESLAQQVVKFQERISVLEQDKEHWMLEAQLLQMKLEKEAKKVLSLERQLDVLQNKSPDTLTDNLDLTPATDHLNNHSKGHIDTSTSLLGKLENLIVSESDAYNREELIKNHFSNRVSELTVRLQVADSKTLHFSAECRALHKRLDLAEKQKERLQREMADGNQTINRLKDELETTTKSYEGQLSMMSEHLAAMNEKLTNQKEEIDVLHYQMQNMKGGKKKGK